MESVEIKSSVTVRCTAVTAFDYFVSPILLVQWWPKCATTQAQIGGIVSLEWFDGSKLSTKYSVFEPGLEIAFPFYDELVVIHFEQLSNSTRIRVEHTVPPSNVQFESCSKCITTSSS